MRATAASGTASEPRVAVALASELRLYMAALVATKHNLVIKTFYRRLLRAGKEKKVALTPCMRMLLVILNTMLRKQPSWQPRGSSQQL
jgi:transposase